MTITNHAQAGSRRCRFGPYRLDLNSHELFCNGRRVRLAEKPFIVLKALLDRPGEVVNREALCRELWPDGTIVDFDNNVNSAVASLREHLHDSARNPSYVETLPRIGYRFISAVQYDDEPVRDLPDRPRRRGASWIVLTAAGLATLVTIVTAAVGFRGVASSAPPAAVSSHQPGRVPDDADARSAYLKGVYLLETSEPENIQKAVSSLSEAARLAPEFALAHAAHAEALSRAAFMDPGGFEGSLEKSREAADRALELDESLAAPHRVLAIAALHLDWDYRKARMLMEQALRLDPLDGLTHLGLASLSSIAGRHDEAITLAERAVELDPASHFLRSDLGFFYLAAGRFEEARRASRAALEIDPDFVPALRFLVLANERLRDFEQAARAIERLDRLGASDAASLDASSDGRAIVWEYHSRELSHASAITDSQDGSALRIALAHAALGHRQEALASLNRAFEAREAFVIYAASYPQFQLLHGDPEFETLVAIPGENNGS